LYAEVEEEKNRIAEQAAFQRKEIDRLDVYWFIYLLNLKQN
jgi:hypothetical protein